MLKVFSRKLFTILMIFSFLFVVTTSCFASQKTVGVFKFSGSTGFGQNKLADIVTNAVISELSNNQKLRVIDRIYMDQLVNEQGLGKTGLINPATAANFGRIVGLDYIIIGNVSDAKIVDHDRFLWNQSLAQVTVSMQVIDAETGAILFADTVNGSVERIRTTDKNGRTTFGDKASTNEYGDAAQNAANKLAQHLSDRLSMSPLTAYVAYIDGNRIYLDTRGNQTVQVGQIFTICRDGNQIKSPITGEILGISKSEICQITIDCVEDKVASGTVSGGMPIIQIGDKAIRQ